MNSLMKPSKKLGGDKKSRIEELKKQRLEEAGESRKKAATAQCTVEEASEKIRIIFDNSGSMSSYLETSSGSSTALEEAKKGVVEFLRCCDPSNTAVGVHLLNTGAEGSSLQEMTSNLIALSILVNSPEIDAYAMTPLLGTLRKALKASPRMKRAIAFSDGGPTDSYLGEEIIASYKDAEIPIDTVYFGASEVEGWYFMKRLAEATGGIFLCFDPSKGVSFASSFKYLAPPQRLRLMSEAFKKDLEAGRIKE